MPQPQIFRSSDGAVDRLKTAEGYVIGLKAWGGIVLAQITACVDSHAKDERPAG
jgi:hypothetical protein